MKRLVNYRRAAQYLDKVFKLVNEQLFDGSPESVTCTIRSSSMSYGHISTEKVWLNPDSASRELNISADYLSRPIENITATLVHEACHLYAMENGIKDTSNKGIYHNVRFKCIAEAHGLIVARHEKYGWTVTEPGERILDFCIDNGLEDIELCRQHDAPAPALTGIGKVADAPGVPRTPRRATSYRRYVCPQCGMIVRATKIVNVWCGDCQFQMVYEP